MDNVDSDNVLNDVETHRGASPALSSDASQSVVGSAAEAIRNGRLVVYPTDTAYAVGCRFDDAAAIQKIMELKGRTDDKFVLIASSQDMVNQFFPMSTAQKELASQHWPGPLSIVVSPKFSVRVPDLEIARELSATVGAPLIATSFNKSGTGAVYDLQDSKLVVDDDAETRLIASLHPNGTLLDHASIGAVIDIGTLPEQLASTVVECTEEGIMVHRHGTVII